jgi:4-cresol dehydrogenase (hydroxylating)
MTIWLMPAPEHFEGFFFRRDSDDGLEDILDSLRPLRLNNTIRSPVHIGNSYKVLSAVRQYPWEELNGRTPLYPDAMCEFRRQYGFGEWNGSGGLYGTRGQVREAKRILRRELRGKVESLIFVDQKKLQWAARFAKPFRFMTGWDLSRTIGARPAARDSYHRVAGQRLLA